MSQASIPLSGRLDVWSGSFDVPELLLAVTRGGRTGRLEMTSREERKCLYLEGGQVRFAASSSHDDRLGIHLLSRKRLSIAALKRLGPRVRPGVRLGALLVEEGVLGAEELQAAVIEQVRAIVLGLFEWTEAAYAFVEDPAVGAEPITLPDPTPSLVFRGIERVPSWRRIVRGLGSLETPLVTVAGNEEGLRSADLDRSSLELLAKMSRPKRVEELCESSDLGDLEICRRLWAFRALGWIAPSEAALDSDVEALGLIFGTPPPGEPS